MSEDDISAVQAGLATALFYLGSVGYHELYMNGVNVSENVLSPSTVDLSQRVRYRVYNVSALLHIGENAVGVWLGPGWAIFEGVNPVMNYNLTKKPIFIAQMQLIHVNETSVSVIETDTADHFHRQPEMTKVQPAFKSSARVLLVTDESWKAHESTTQHIGLWTSGNFGGDAVDARLDIPGWCTVELDDHDWDSAVDYTDSLRPRRHLTADTVQPTRRRSIVSVTTVVPVSNVSVNAFLC